MLAVAYDVTSSSPLELVEALDGRCDLVWVVDVADPALGAWRRLLPRLGQVVDRAGREPGDVAAELGRLGVDGVVAFADSQLPVAAEVGEALGLDGNSAGVVRLLTDKVAQRQALRAAGLPGPGFVAVPAGTPVDVARDLIAHLSFPMVIKPRRGSGSQDTVRVEDGQAAASHLGATLGGDRCPELIVEEWLEDLGPDRAAPGPFADYVSVEAVASRGTIVPLAVTGKFALAEPCRETGNFLPHLLDAHDARAVVDTASHAASALGVRTGALHVEVKLTPAGPRVIEVNGRVGGGGIDALFASVHGRSLTSVAAAVAMGEPVAVDPVRTTGSGGPFAYAYFLQAPVEARTLTGLGDLGALQALDGVLSTSVNRTVGDALDWRDGSMGYLLSVRGRADGPEDLARVPDRVADVLDVTWD